MTRQDLIELHQELTSKARELMVRKNADYTGGGGPFANFETSQMYGVHRVKGALIRLNDKLQRINSFVTQDLQVKDESVEDTIIDVINYVVLIAGMIREEKSTKVIQNLELTPEKFTKMVQERQNPKLGSTGSIFTPRTVPDKTLPDVIDDLYEHFSGKDNFKKGFTTSPSLMITALYGPTYKEVTVKMLNTMKSALLKVGFEQRGELTFVYGGGDVGKRDRNESLPACEDPGLVAAQTEHLIDAGFSRPDVTEQAWEDYFHRVQKTSTTTTGNTEVCYQETQEPGV